MDVRVMILLVFVSNSLVAHKMTYKEIEDKNKLNTKLQHNKDGVEELLFNII